MTYKPTFSCEYCGSVIETKVHGTFNGMPTGSVGACTCPESQAAWERDHRAKMEQRKKARGGRR